MAPTMLDGRLPVGSSRTGGTTFRGAVWDQSTTWPPGFEPPWRSGSGGEFFINGDATLIDEPELRAVAVRAASPIRPIAAPSSSGRHTAWVRSPLRSWWRSATRGGGPPTASRSQPGLRTGHTSRCRAEYTGRSRSVSTPGSASHTAGIALITCMAVARHAA